MAIKNLAPKAYHLNHPVEGIPAMAEYHGYWQQNGRNIGLKLRFPGEAFDRHLTYREVENLQRPEEEALPCT